MACHEFAGDFRVGVDHRPPHRRGVRGLCLACGETGVAAASTDSLVFAYCALLVGPASQIYGRVDTWQNLAATGDAVHRDAAGRPLILFAPDETTRAFVDMYARTSVKLIPAPATAMSAELLQILLSEEPDSLVLAQATGRTYDPVLRRIAARLALERRAPPKSDPEPVPVWASQAHLHRVQLYELPNGRRYALFEARAPMTSR